jgi:crotonobetainyl-CoA:carnitine CoA-transferase CaiB-like acyl-CoA transferase
MRVLGNVRIGLESPLFMAFNRNKRGITLDLRRSESRPILDRLLETADVFVHNFRPSFAKSIGLDYDTLATRFTKLVYCAISGYGAHPDDADRPAADGVIQAASGLMSLTGEREPAMIGIPVCDTVAATLSAIGILAALREREQSGAGQQVDVTLFDASVFALTSRAAEYLTTNTQPPRLGTGHQQLCPYGAFPTADDRYLYIAPINDSDWRALCDVLQLTEAASNPRFASLAKRLALRAEVNEMVAAATIRRPIAELETAIAKRNIMVARVQELPDVFADPMIARRSMLKRVNHSTVGAMDVIGIPIKLSRTCGSITRAAPILGEHTDEVLAQLGFSRAVVSAWREKGVI